MATALTQIKVVSPKLIGATSTASISFRLGLTVQPHPYFVLPHLHGISASPWTLDDNGSSLMPECPLYTPIFIPLFRWCRGFHIKSRIYVVVEDAAGPTITDLLQVFISGTHTQMTNINHSLILIIYRAKREKKSGTSQTPRRASSMVIVRWIIKRIMHATFYSIFFLKETRS
jgi:hypothetical protein